MASVDQETAAQQPADARRPAGAQSPPVTVVILTFNEENNIGPCIRSCAWCDDVHVVDSGSTDRTCEIARAMGATVHRNPFVSFSQQRNWAIDNVPGRHPWQFHLDADERFTPEVVGEMYRELGPDGTRSEKAAYLVPNKMIFMGQWVKHSVGSPAQVRLLCLGRCRFVDFGHGQRESTRGEVGRLTQAYLHYNFSKGLLDWLTKHNGYATREAEEALKVKRVGRPRWTDFVHENPTVRRRALKNLSYFLWGRPILRFIQVFFFSFGWLDGIAGFHYAAMISMYEYWTSLKVQERQGDWGRRTDELVARLLAEPK